MSPSPAQSAGAAGLVLPRPPLVPGIRSCCYFWSSEQGLVNPSPQPRPPRPSVSAWHSSFLGLQAPGPLGGTFYFQASPGVCSGGSYASRCQFSLPLSLCHPKALASDLQRFQHSMVPRRQLRFLIMICHRYLNIIQVITTILIVVAIIIDCYSVVVDHVVVGVVAGELMTNLK